MDAALFDYELPEASIAQTPAQRRDASRLLVVHRDTQTVEHAQFSDLPQFLPTSTCLFRNNVAVLKARLRGRRDTGGAVECFLIHPSKNGVDWWALLKPGKKLKPGDSFQLPERVRAHVLEKNDEGHALLHFDLPEGEGVVDFATRHGEVPLPPYIHRDHSDAVDEERYQTVYADAQQKRAVAAPTAGLHFTPELDAHLAAEGHSLLPLTLHVGIGTFKPVQAEQMEQHQMHSEFYRIPAATLDALLDDSRPRLAVGTTSLRAIEDACRKGVTPSASGFESEASLYILPPDRFHVEHMITNFHLPRSTLMCLVSAFLTPGATDGIQWLKALYQQAIRDGYRFYSYGDAMLIL